MWFSPSDDNSYMKHWRTLPHFRYVSQFFPGEPKWRINSISFLFLVLPPPHSCISPSFPLSLLPPPSPPLRLGCPQFTEPHYDLKVDASASRSLFYPDEAIWTGHPRYMWAWQTYESMFITKYNNAALFLLEPSLVTSAREEEKRSPSMCQVHFVF